MYLVEVCQLLDVCFSGICKDVGGGTRGQASRDPDGEQHPAPQPREEQQLQVSHSQAGAVAALRLHSPALWHLRLKQQTKGMHGDCDHRRYPEPSRDLDFLKWCLTVRSPGVWRSVIFKLAFSLFNQCNSFQSLPVCVCSVKPPALNVLLLLDPATLYSRTAMHQWICDKWKEWSNALLQFQRNLLHETQPY